MEFLECKICHNPYDEGDRRPRNAPCGHEWCSSCISELIKDSVFSCPKCRQKNKVNIPEDLPISYALIDLIRAFKTQKTELKTSGALGVDVCKVHQKSIEDRCLKCQRWLCKNCLKAHTELVGCSTIDSSKAMKSMKEEQTKSVDVLLSKFEDRSKDLLSTIKEHNVVIENSTRKIKELKQLCEWHGIKIKEIQQILEHGKQQKENVLKSKEALNAANSPSALTDGIDILEDNKLILQSWSVTKLQMDFPNAKLPPDISEAVEECGDAYVQKIINDRICRGKLTQHKGCIHFHTFRTINIRFPYDVFMPFDHLQYLIPPSPTLVFMEISLDGAVEGNIYIRLHKDMINIREHMVQLVTGMQGYTLAEIALNEKDKNSIKNLNLKLKLQVTCDSNARSMAKRGSVMGYYNNGYLESIYFQIAACKYKTSYTEIGCIESGMDIIQECYDYHNLGVVITDCGLVLEQK